MHILEGEYFNNTVPTQTHTSQREQGLRRTVYSGFQKV